MSHRTRLTRSFARLVAGVAVVIAGFAVVASPVGATPTAPPPTVAPAAPFTTTATLDAANAYLKRDFANAYDYDYIQNDMYVSQTDPSSGYFYMNGFQMQGDSGFGGYIGLQTKMTDCAGNWDRPGIVFTMWNVPTGWNSAWGGYACSNTEAGQPFISVHVPYNWVNYHTYRFYLQRYLYGGTYYVSAKVYDLTTFPADGSTVNVGFMQQPASWSWFQPLGQNGRATEETEEFYPNAYADCNNIAVSRSVWGASYMHSIGGGWIAANALVAHWTDAGAPGHCTNSNSKPETPPQFTEVVGALS